MSSKRTTTPSRSRPRSDSAEGSASSSSFTWSKNIDYGRSSTNEATEGQTASGFVTQHIRDLSKNRARSYLNRSLAYNLSYLYDVPLGPGRKHLQSGPLGWIAGGLGTVGGSCRYSPARLSPTQSCPIHRTRSAPTVATRSEIPTFRSLSAPWIDGSILGLLWQVRPGLSAMPAAT